MHSKFKKPTLACCVEKGTNYIFVVFLLLPLTLSRFQLHQENCYWAHVHGGKQNLSILHQSVFRKTHSAVEISYQLTLRMKLILENDFRKFENKIKHKIHFYFLFIQSSIIQVLESSRLKTQICHVSQVGQGG